LAHGTTLRHRLVHNEVIVEMEAQEARSTEHLSLLDSASDVIAPQGRGMEEEATRDKHFS